MAGLAFREMALQQEAGHTEWRRIDVGPWAAVAATVDLVGLIAEALHWSVSEPFALSSHLYSFSVW